MINFNYINAGESLIMAQHLLMSMSQAEHFIEVYKTLGNKEKITYYEKQLSTRAEALEKTLQNAFEPFTKYITA